MNLGSLVSETRNPQTMDLDALSTLELVNRFNQQDTLVAQAVKETLPEVAKAVDAAAEALKAGGRIIYMGAGTSGRLGVLDAPEGAKSDRSGSGCWAGGLRAYAVRYRRSGVCQQDGLHHGGDFL